MSKKRIFSFFFSCLMVISFGQKGKIEKKESYTPNFMVGIDVLNAGMSFFSDKKTFQGFVSSKIKNNWHAAADIGYESNVYIKNGYDAKVKGPYTKFGGFYMMSKDPDHEFNGFYLGSKLALSYYQQEYLAVPVRGYGGSNSSVAFPVSKQFSTWIEGNAGGRIRLFDTPLYIDVNIQPKYLLYTTKQDGIRPMVIPGFGRSSGKFNVGFAWNIAYMF